MRNRREQRVFIAVFLAPALFLFTLFVAFPSVRALGYSLQRWDGLGTPEWAGLSNFTALFRDSDLFLVALRHNVFLMAVGGGSVLALSLFFAALLHRRIRGATVFRVAFFFPNVISAVAIALLWVLLYSTTEFGVINAALAQGGALLTWPHTAPAVAVLCALGLCALFAAGILLLSDSARLNKAQRLNAALVMAACLAAIWFAVNLASDFIWFRGTLYQLHTALEAALPFPFVDSKYVLYALVPMMVWTATGFYMVLFLAAMENIPETFYEVARLEGASAAAQFWHITLPLIREVLTVGLVFLVISTLKFFDAIWVMENQWPTRESHVLATLLYQKVFTEYNVGYGSAVAVLLFLLVFAATVLTLRLARREALEY